MYSFAKLLYAPRTAPKATLVVTVPDNCATSHPSPQTPPHEAEFFESVVARAFDAREPIADSHWAIATLAHAATANMRKLAKSMAGHHADPDWTYRESRHPA